MKTFTLPSFAALLHRDGHLHAPTYFQILQGLKCGTAWVVRSTDRQGTAWPLGAEARYFTLSLACSASKGGILVLSADVVKMCLSPRDLMFELSLCSSDFLGKRAPPSVVYGMWRSIIAQSLAGEASAMPGGSVP